MQIRQEGDDPPPPGPEPDPEAWARAGIAALQRALAAADLDELDGSIQVLRAAAEAIPPDHVEHPGALSHLGVVLWLQFERTGAMQSLAASLQAHRRAVAEASDALVAAALTNFAVVLKSHFLATRELASLEEAVQAQRRAAEATWPGHPDHATNLANLAETLRLYWDQTGDLGHLDEAIAAGRRALEATPQGDPNRARLMADLGDNLECAFDETGDPELLEEAISVLRHAAALAVEGGTDWATALDRLSSALSTLYERGGDLADLDEAIGVGRRAVAATPADAPNRSGRLLRLARNWQSRHVRSQKLADVDQAVRLGREALALAPPSDRYRDVFFAFLGTALHDRWRQHRDAGGFDEVVRLYEEAVAAAPADRAAQALSNLSLALSERHERTGDLADLDRAVELGRQAISRTAADPARQAEALSTLAGAVEAGYRRGATRSGIDEVLRLRRAALALTAPYDEHRPRRLDDLGRVLCDQFEASHELAVIDEAVALHEQAAAATPANHPQLASYLSNLGNAYASRSDRTRQQADVDRAIQVHRRAVASAPPGERLHATALGNLGAAIQARYHLTGDLADLQEAIGIHRRVLAVLPEGEEGQARGSANLGTMLRAHYLQTGEVASLEEAVAAQRRAVAATPKEHPNRAILLHNLGRALRTSLERSREEGFLAEALDAFEAAAGQPAGSVDLRIAAATQLGELAVQAGDVARAARGFGTAVELLARLAPRHLARRDAEHWLRRFSGLASDAAACALEAGDPGRAVSLLEMGRGVLLSQALEGRSDLTDLREKAPELAERYEALSGELDRLGGDSDTAPTAGAERRRGLSSELDMLIDRIRAIPTWERFLLPPTLEELAGAAAGGPIVLVTVSGTRGHALVLTGSGVRMVALPGLTRDAALRRADLFVHSLGIVLDRSSSVLRRWNAEQLVREVLAWLWDTVTGPVLDALGLDQAPPAGAPLPRVWWVPTGLLTHLPLHAAGHHDGPDRRTVMDRVVSSYTPTVRALTYARSRRPDGSSPPRMLVVAMPETYGASDLPGAEREAELLRTRFPDAVVLSRGRATQEEVLTWLPTATRVHFACHGVSDPTDPSSSRLLLYDHERSPMTVLAVSRLRLRGVELAYLSACDTARVSPDLADEAAHITAAFQLAGFPEVVGTLWTVDDNVAVQVAARVYSVNADGPVGGDGRVAAAVHIATRELRDQYPKSPSLWAAHMHTGA